MTSKLIHIREREENIARRRSPISKEMFVAIANHACDSDRDSAESVIFDWITLGRVAGFRVAEYAQTTQNKVDEFEYASGNRVIKAFIPPDWQFYNKKGRLMTVHSLDGLTDPPTKMKMTFRIQKNRQNGQSITFVADDKHPNNIESSYEPNVWANQMTSQWASLPITRASRNTSRRASKHQIGGRQIGYAGRSAKGGIDGNCASNSADRDVLKAVLGTNWTGKSRIAHDDSSHAS